MCYMNSSYVLAHKPPVDYNAWIPLRDVKRVFTYFSEQIFRCQICLLVGRDAVALSLWMKAFTQLWILPLKMQQMRVSLLVIYIALTWKVLIWKVIEKHWKCQALLSVSMHIDVINIWGERTVTIFHCNFLKNETGL